LLTLGHWLNTWEKSEVPAQTTPLKGGVWAGTALFSLATSVVYGGERVKRIYIEILLQSTTCSWMFSETNLEYAG